MGRFFNHLLCIFPYETSEEGLEKFQEIRVSGIHQELFHISQFLFLRFDQNTIQTLQTFEAIFGPSMWNHVVAETSYWSHSQYAVDDRWNNGDEVKSFENFHFHQNIVLFVG